MRHAILILLSMLCLWNASAIAQDDHAADRQALIGILHDVEKGINDSNIDLMARHFDDKAVITWLNAETSRGPQGVKDYFARMVGDAPGAVLSKYATHPKISGPATFYGDVAVASGTMEDEFTPHKRSVFKFDSRWTATLNKTGGEWKIVALHLSTNSFNNALTDELRQLSIYTGAGGAAVGLLLAIAWFWWRRRKQ
ncbi:nuclear transport factor 2 family protein [Uliginosibacterium sp. H3]|uniref:Nuclear transport factor 2 family protein n=1 Tax=Uliginosibacterium silvisoli TaxID=3114758 RepID=A0ABU6K2J2_9RHOO|nr:nuclear transport factor 2 family protein [Uliginosibacterium sp. H3]